MAYFNLDDHTIIYYEEYGSRDNPTIIFCNGIVFTTASWNLQKKALSEKFHLIFYDMRCQGNSSCEKKQFDYTLHVHDLKFLIDYLQLVDPVIAGISYGSFVAKEFAVQYPDDLKKLILLTPLHSVDFITQTIYDNWVHFLKHNMLKEFFDLTILVSYKDVRNYITDEVYQRELVNFKDKYDADSIMMLMNSIDKETMFKNYNIIKVPTLLISAKYDLLHNPTHSDLIAKEIDNSRVITIDGGHAVNIECFKEVNEAIIDFI